MKLKRISRKNALFSTIIIALLCTTTVFAVLYMTKELKFKATIKKYGTIDILGLDMMPLTSWDFGEFEPNATGTQNRIDAKFYIVNTGNIPVKVSYQLTSSSNGFAWDETLEAYVSYENLNLKWKTKIFEASGDVLLPVDSATTEYIQINAGETYGGGVFPYCYILLDVCPTGMWSGEDLSFTLSFYAEEV